jgi:hypothetical protein
MLNRGVSEFARVFGVDFFSVISRGSQFKVESFMFRIAKPESFVLLSPSKQDVREIAFSFRISPHPMLGIGWQAERSRMHAAYHGADFRLLLESPPCA